LVNIEELEKPLVIDLFAVQANQGTRYDLPIYYLGELMSTNQELLLNKDLLPMGEHDGYQHLWQEGHTELKGSNFKMTWLNQRNFYSVTSIAEEGDQVILTRIGANDPSFNLRRDPGLIHRRKAGNTVFASLYEMHGSYSYSTEIPINSFSSITELKILNSSEEYLIIQFGLQSGEAYRFAFSLTDSAETGEHTVKVENSQEISWTGVYDFKKTED
ncbi:MAG: heparinase, partial [Bacteroidota bacterium]